MDTVSFSAGFVLAAANGLHIRRSATTGSTVELVSSNGVVNTFGNPFDPRTLNFVSGASFAPDGSIWLVDRGNKKLLHLTETLRPIAVYTAVGATNLVSPHSIASLSDGRLVLTDTHTGVHLLNPSKATPTTLPASTLMNGFESGQNSAPPKSTKFIAREIAVGSDNSIVVHDRSNGATRRLLRLNTDGTATRDPQTIDAVVTSVATTSDGHVLYVDGSTKTVTSTQTLGADATYEVAVTNRPGDEIKTLQGKTITLANLGGVSNSSAHRFWIGGMAVDAQNNGLVLGLPHAAQKFRPHKGVFTWSS